MQQPRIDFGMVLPTQWGLEQFLEMTKALKQIEDKYTNPQALQFPAETKQHIYQCCNQSGQEKSEP